MTFVRNGLICILKMKKYEFRSSLTSWTHVYYFSQLYLSSILFFISSNQFQILMTYMIILYRILSKLIFFQWLLCIKERNWMNYYYGYYYYYYLMWCYLPKNLIYSFFSLRKNQFVKCIKDQKQPGNIKNIYI